MEKWHIGMYKKARKQAQIPVYIAMCVCAIAVQRIVNVSWNAETHPHPYICPFCIVSKDRGIYYIQIVTRMWVCSFLFYNPYISLLIVWKWSSEAYFVEHIIHPVKHTWWSIYKLHCVLFKHSHSNGLDYETLAFLIHSEVQGTLKKVKYVHVCTIFWYSTLLRMQGSIDTTWTLQHCANPNKAIFRRTILRWCCYPSRCSTNWTTKAVQLSEFQVTHTDWSPVNYI